MNSDAPLHQQPVQPNSSTRPDPDAWDALLGKYVSVWIWSILTGITVSIAISFTSVRATSRGLLGAVLAFPVLLGVVAILGALRSLLAYLKEHLIPVFLAPGPMPDLHRPESVRPARHLHRALQFVIYSIALRLVTAAVEIVVNVLAF